MGLTVLLFRGRDKAGEKEGGCIKKGKKRKGGREAERKGDIKESEASYFWLRHCIRSDV